MAVNKPIGDNARKGAVKKRTELKNPLTKTSTKRNKKGGNSWPSRRALRNTRAFGKRSDEARHSGGNHPNGAHCVFGVGDCAMT